MHKILRASKDAYITNRHIRGEAATSANLGGSHTLDLFKIGISGSSPDLSRLLIQFDLQPIRSLLTVTPSLFSDPTFRCHLELKDVYGGQTTPRNFGIEVHPLSRSFDEGEGRDVVQYTDYDVCNWLTASVGSPWVAGGASFGGPATSTVDYISASLDGSPWGASQLFITGEENLRIDVTKIVSATLAAALPDVGWRVALSSAVETNDRTYFVKRFGARTAYDDAYHPRLIVQFDDSIQDDGQALRLDDVGELFIYNTSMGNRAHLVSGSTSVTGANSLLLKLQYTSSATSGSTRNLYFTGSEHSVGVYSALVHVPSSDPFVASAVSLTGSLNVTPVWTSFDESITYQSGSVIQLRPRSASSTAAWIPNYFVSLPDVQSDIVVGSTQVIRVNLFDYNSQLVRVVKRPVEMPGETVRDVHYQVRNLETGEIVVPFDTVLNSTRCSSDNRGMWFNLDTSGYNTERRYTVDIKIVANGTERTYLGASQPFRIKSL